MNAFILPLFLLLHSQGAYLPPDAFVDTPDDQEYQDFMEEIYGSIFADLGKESLWKLSQTDSNAEAYRLLVIAPGTTPTVFHLYKTSANGWSLEVTRLEYDSDDNGTIVEFIKIAPDQTSALKIKSLFQSNTVWDYPTAYDFTADCPPPNPDGTQNCVVVCSHSAIYLLERVENGQYAFRDENKCPRDRGADVVPIINAFGRSAYPEGHELLERFLWWAE